MSTKAQLRASIKKEARIKSTDTLDGMVDDIVLEVLRDYCNKSRYYELLQENVAIVVVAGQQTYSLPANFHNLNAVRFGRGPTPTTFRNVSVQPASVRQTWSYGSPRFYRLVAGPKISFFPYGGVLTTDQIFIDYYADPGSLFLLDTDNFPIPRLESAVKKDTIARVLNFTSASTEGEVQDRNAAGSFIAAESASH